MDEMVDHEPAAEQQRDTNEHRNKKRHDRLLSVVRICPNNVEKQIWFLVACAQRLQPANLSRTWCRRPDSNRDGGFPPTDFKSDASTNSATSARTASSIARRPAGSARSILADVTPDLVPDLAGRVGHATIFLVELVRDLEDRQHQAAFRRPG